MKHKLLPFFILLLACLYSLAQSNTTVVNGPLTNDSLYPGGQTTWGRFLKNNVDTTVPVNNRAKKGVYAVVVKFVISKDGSFSDIAATTNHGYGMEQEVIRVFKKYKSWTPAPQNEKPVYRVGYITFTFTVTKRRLFVRRKAAKKKM